MARSKRIRPGSRIPKLLIFFVRHERAQNQLQCDELHLESIFNERASSFSGARFGNDHVLEQPENFYVGELTFYRVQHFVVVGHLGLDFSDCFCVRVARENEKALRVVDGFATALLAQSAFLRRFLEKIED